MENPSKIYFVIVTYNAMKWAEKCFSSLRRSSVSVQTIVVDNGSTDGTQDFIKENFPEVNLIENTDNLGFGKANNIGIEIAIKNGADFFYLMNQDAWIYEDSIQKLLDVYDNYPKISEIGILSPMHLDGSEKKLDIFLDKYIAQNFETRMISDFYFNAPQSSYEISFINAAHWFIPKDTIEKVGGFNPYFFHYGEDLEYANRLKYHGKKILICPKSKVVHDGIQNLTKVDYTKYEDLTIETKIINPNLPDALHREKRALQQSMLKTRLLMNRAGYKELKRKYRKIVSEEKILLEMAAKVKEIGPTFLKV